MSKNNKNSKLHNLLLLLNTTTLVFSLNTKLFDLLPNIDEPFSRKTDFTNLGLTAAEITKLKNPDWSIIEKDLNWAEGKGHHIITIEDADYPELLKEIPSPPLVLFVVGESLLLRLPQLAIVGSRNPTPIGSQIAYNFAKVLVDTGLVITSGFAAGIDAASHKGAMAGLGKTIAVMGTGLNHIYPKYHIDLAQQIINNQGILLSEFPLAAKAAAWHFPLRNRIISGLSMGTLVVEATMRSGSLITARLATEQGREVFAVPGSIYSNTSHGCHHLLKQGAKLVEKPDDILEELPKFTLSKQNLSPHFNELRDFKKINLIANIRNC